MANISESELLQVVNDKLADADTERNRLYRRNQYLNDRYNAKPYGTEVAGRSSFVSNDVKDAVEDAHDELVNVFLGAGPIIKFNPTNPKNEKQINESEEKTKFVDWIVRGQTDSYQVQSGVLTDILKLKAGQVKYYYEKTESTEDHSWTGLTEEGVIEQLDAIVEDNKNREAKLVKNNQQDDGTFDITIRVKVTREELKVVGVPSESFLITKGARTVDDAELVGDELTKTRGQLLSEGHSRELVAKLPSFDTGQNGYSSRYRDIQCDDDGYIRESDFSEWASQLVSIYDLYVKVDYNGDGISERRHIEKAGDYILVNEPFDHVPYARTSALLTPHCSTGQGWGEQVTDIAEVNTAITRGTLDNIYSVNNTKKAVRVGRNGVNLDEAGSSAIGGLVQVRGERPLTDMIMPLTTEFIGDKALLIKQSVDLMKSKRIGGAMTTPGLNGDDLSKETATRFTGLEKKDSKKIAKVARNIAEVFYRKLYEGVAWLAKHHQIEDVQLNVLGKALSVNPKSWRFDNNISTDIGLGASDNENIINTMTGVWGIQQQLKAEGSKMIDEEKQYNTVKTILRASEIKDPSLFVNDPSEPEEQLKADNEQLNAMVLQMQEAMQAQSEQIRQLQALSEVEMIKAQSKAEADNKAAALNIAKLQENQRQFDIKTAQDGSKIQTDTALNLTKLEIDSGQDLNAEVADNMLVFDPAIGDFV